MQRIKAGSETLAVNFTFEVLDMLKAKETSWNLLLSMTQNVAISVRNNPFR